MPNVREEPGSETLRGFTRGLRWFGCCRFPAAGEATQGHPTRVVGTSLGEKAASSAS